MKCAFATLKHSLETSVKCSYIRFKTHSRVLVLEGKAMSPSRHVQQISKVILENSIDISNRSNRVSNRFFDCLRIVA